MTASYEKPWRNAMVLPPVLALLLLLLWKNRALTDGIRAGLCLAGHTVLPALFPFAVLSSYLVVLTAPAAGRRRRLPISTVPFCIGLLCGFPLGAKTACDGVRLRQWSVKDAETMLCFCNNTGVAFLIAGVGAMRGSVRDGIFLFCLQTLIALLSGALLSIGRRRRMPPAVAPLSPMPIPRFTEVMRNAVNASLAVTGYIAFFSGLTSVLRSMLPTSLFPYVAAALEVGGACQALAKTPGGLPLTAFAVIFSGLSVHLQTASFAVESGVRVFPAVIVKAVGGILGATLTILFMRFAP